MAAALVSFIGHGVQYSFGVFLKPLSEGLDWSRPVTAAAASIFYLCRAVSSIAMGGLSDRLGPRVVVGFGGLLMGAGMVLGALIGSPWQLYLFYGVMAGWGMGAAYSPLTATAARWFERHRGLAIGVIEASCGLGSLAFAPLAGYLISAYGWSWAYLVMGLVALVLIIGSASFLRKSPADMGLRSLGSGEFKQSTPVSGEEFTLAQAARQGRFWVLLSLGLLVGFAQFTVMVNLVAHATDSGIGELQAPFLISIIGGLWVAGSLMSGALCGRFGGRRIILISGGAFVLAVFSLNLTSSFGILAFLSVVIGLCMGSLWVAVAKTIAEFFGLKAMGATWGSLLMVNLIGAIAGASAPNLIYQASQPHSYAAAFWLAGALAAAGVGLFMLATGSRREVA